MIHITNKIRTAVSIMRMKGELIAKNPSTIKMIIPSNCAFAVLFIFADIQKNSKTMDKSGDMSNE